MQLNSSQIRKIMTLKEKIEVLSWPCQEEDYYRNRCKVQCDFCKEEYIRDEEDF